MREVSRGNEGFQGKGSLLFEGALSESRMDFVHLILGYVPVLFAAVIVVATGWTISYFLFRIFSMLARGLNLLVFGQSLKTLPSDAFYATFGVGAAVPLIASAVRGLDIIGFKIPDRLFLPVVTLATELFYVGTPVLILIRSFQFLALMIDRESAAGRPTTPTHKPEQ